jgi:hypothetical protein
MLDSHRLNVPYPWTWTDTPVSVDDGMQTWSCYFRNVETTCLGEVVLPGVKNEIWSGIPCENAEYNVTEFHAAAAEFRVSSCYS